MAENLKLLDDASFDNGIAKGIVLVDFYADWCGPCKRIAPVIEQLANEMQGKVTVVKVDVDTSQQTAAKFEVMSIPTLMIFVNGKKVETIVGLTSLDNLRNKLVAAGAK